MGQEQSNIIDDKIPPNTLSERSLKAVAQHIKDGKAREIVAMVGAGISTSSGIPDFRSPGTGLYDNLARYQLPYPEAVFDISFFRTKPEPFYDLAQALYPGRYRPTISHVFLALLAHRGLLKMLFTQNIDCLERAAGVPPDLIVEAHGSFAANHCIECQTAFPDDQMRDHVEAGIVPTCPKCEGLVKPDIVFFGESLPKAFFQNIKAPEMADLVLVMGTSLSVQPFSRLPEIVPKRVPRVLFNLERVGTLGSHPDDVVVIGDCDTGVRRLADELGWRDELEAEWRRLVGDTEAERQISSAEKREQVHEEKEEAAAEEKEEEEVEISELAAEMEEALRLGGETDEDRGQGAADEEVAKVIAEAEAEGQDADESTGGLELSAPVGQSVEIIQVTEEVHAGSLPLEGENDVEVPATVSSASSKQAEETPETVTTAPTESGKADIANVKDEEPKSEVAKAEESRVERPKVEEAKLEEA